MASNPTYFIHMTFLTLSQHFDLKSDTLTLRILPPKALITLNARSTLLATRQYGP